MRVKTQADWEKERPILIERLLEFAAVMRRPPFQNYEGLRGVSAFALYWFVAQIRPTAVFEIGVWKGFSTWIIEQAAPEAELFCFDPLFFLEQFIDREKLGRTYRSPRARYSREEFSCADIRAIVAAQPAPLAFFDDHQNQLPRLFQAQKAGIRHLIFDDNPSYPCGHRTLQHERENRESLAIMEKEIDAYEVFPALWPFDWVVNGVRVREDGMDFPLLPELMEIYEERKWHSYVTYVRLMS